MIPPLHSVVRFLRDIGASTDPWEWEWARVGDEGAIVQIVPDSRADTPRGYVVEIVTPIDGQDYPACRIVCCAAKDVEVIWSPDDPS